MVPITDCMKDGKFSWSDATIEGFQIIKQKLTSAAVLLYPISLCFWSCMVMHQRSVLGLFSVRMGVQWHFLLKI